MTKHLGRTAIGVLVPAWSLGLASCMTETTSPPGQAPAATISAKRKQSLAAAFPEACTDRAGKGVSKIFGPSLAEGATPDEAAETFKRNYGATKGVTEEDLTPYGLPPGQAAQQLSSGIGLMPDDDTGKPKFWLYRYQQKHHGRRVFRAALSTLVRNDGSNAVVWASSTLRDLSGFEARDRTKKLAPDPVRSLQAIQGISDSSGLPVPLPTEIASISEPELIIFAGPEDEETSPRMAIEYRADTVPAGKWRLVADAESGDILHVRSLLVFATVTGTVHGFVTQGASAAECSSAVKTAFPEAEIDGLPGEKTYTDASGAFSLSTGATGSLEVTSPMAGRRFVVTDFSGPREDLVSSVTPPGPVAFVHNGGAYDEMLLAQANAYVQANEIRSFLLKYVPNFPTISTEVDFPILVNLTSATDYLCPGEGHYSGTAISLCLGTSAYANTSFAGVTHHEYGHHIVRWSGSDELEYAEGIADAVAALFSGQHGHAFGLLRNQCTVPIRDAANVCQYSASNCSSCGREIHRCGQLLSGIIWSIRSELAVTNPATYTDIINSLTLNSTLLHQGSSITSQIAIDFLTLDDDDGNLNNGTPHYSEICAGFAAHGLLCPALKTDLAVSPATGLSAEGPVGGPFSPSSVTYTVKNLGPAPSLQYQVAPTPNTPWLSITNASGQLAINQSRRVTVSINQGAAASLAKGNYTPSIKFTNKTNGVGSTLRPIRLRVGTPQAVYTEDFESGLGTFSVDSGPSGLWHVSANCASTSAGHSRPQSLYFGLDANCTYDDGTPHAGSVTSIPITLSNASLARLRFNYFLGTEGVFLTDQVSVQVSVNGGIFWTLASNSAELCETQLLDGTGAWQAADFDLTPYLAGLATASLRVRFLFDTIDKIENHYPGFLVDDVKIVAFGGGVANQSPTVDAGANQTVTLPAPAALAGTAGDDGQPNPPGKLTTTWSKAGGPGTVTFANPGALTTTATFSAAGTYTLRLTANDGALSAKSEVVVTVNPAPTPCSGLCANPVHITVDGSFQSGNIGTGAICYETTSVTNGGNCGNFVSPRTLTVNGVTEPCNYLNWPTLPPKRNGGYCIQTTPGDHFYAYVVLFY